MQPAGPQCSCSKNDESGQLANANVNRCSQHQVGNIDDTASSGLGSLVCLAAPGGTATHTRNEAWTCVDKLASSDVHSGNEHASSPLMRGMGECKCNTATLEQKKKATSDEQQKEIGVASSDCATETSVGSLNDSRSSSTSTSLDPNKSENGKTTTTEKSSKCHPQRSVSSTTTDSSPSSTDLLYHALHDRSLNDSSSSSSADAGTDQLLSSQEDEAETPRNKSQNSTQIRRKRKRIVHPNAQDQSVSSLNSNSSCSSPVLAQAQCDSSSSSSGSPKPE